MHSCDYDGRRLELRDDGVVFVALSYAYKFPDSHINIMGMRNKFQHSMERCDRGVRRVTARAAVEIGGPPAASRPPSRLDT